VRRPTWQRRARPLAAALALWPLLAAASPPPPAPAPLGVVAGLDIGGGASLGGSDASHDLVEVELSLGYELWAGLRPEAALLLGTAPRTYAGVRLGLHYALPGTPLYARAAIDAATVSGAWDWRWLFFGGGAELRLTDLLGLFGEADVGLPLGSLGYGTLLRAGVTLRF
jgi:hypothetical protein